MNADAITLKEVLQWMDSPEPFSMMVITANKQRDTGGEQLFLKDVKGYRQKSRREAEALSKGHKEEKKFKRNPNHYDNSTRNVLLKNGDIITIHIRLIRTFNGKTVL